MHRCIWDFRLAERQKPRSWGVAISTVASALREGVELIPDLITKSPISGS